MPASVAISGCENHAPHTHPAFLATPLCPFTHNSVYAEYPNRIKIAYMQQHKRCTLKEHTEIQLVRFYLENPQIIPAINYFGVSEYCCFLCDSFLKELQDPDKPGAPVTFCCA